MKEEEKERGKELKNMKNRIQKELEKIETEDISINIGIEDLGSEMVENAGYSISALRKREERKGKEKKREENRGKVRKVRGNMIASSHLVLLYPFPSFSILRYSVMICSIRLANILQFLVKY